MTSLNQHSKIFLTGHKGMVGSTLFSKLKERGYNQILTQDKNSLDLREQSLVRNYFEKERPEIVLIIAAKVGGIAANIQFPADFLYDNLMIEANLIKCSYEFGVKKILYLGSSCIYPKDSPQPMKEEYLLTGLLEPTNEGYAIAKIAGLKLLEYFRKQYGLDYVSLMPSNIYGPGDSFHPQHSHVLSANVKRFVDAVDSGSKEVIMWGTGIAKREFLHVFDLADIAIEMLEKNISVDNFINVGTGKEISIFDLAKIIANLSGFKGDILWDSTKPDGMLRKCMDVSKLNEKGLFAKIKLNDGIKEMIQLYKEYKVRNTI